MSLKKTGIRRLRSFVRREGRITKAQARALEAFWPKYGKSVAAGCEQAFWNALSEPVLEIGFGMGHSFLAMASTYQQESYIGVEVHRPGVGAVLAAAGAAGLHNLYVYAEDAVSVCEHCIPDEVLARVQIFFPDPWPKKRHQKRRLIQADFVCLLISKLRTGGILHLATDVASYAEHMHDVLAQQPLLAQVSDLSTLTYQRPETKFERAGLAKGHQIVDWVYRKKGDKPHG